MFNLKSIFVLSSLAVLASAAMAQSGGRRTSPPNCENICSDVFYAVGQIGNSNYCPNTPRFHEMGLGPTKGSLIHKAEYNWKLNVATPWEVKYTAATKQVSFNINGQVLRYTLAANQRVDKLIINARAQGNDCGPSAWISLDQVCWNSDAVAFGKVNGGQSRTVTIAGKDFSQNWTLGGYAKMYVPGQGSPTAAQFSVTGVQCVPEPGTMTALGLGIASIIRKRKASKKK